MRVSREQVAENRRKILDAAGGLFRAKGFDSVTVGEVMKAAGLTHGGFYVYFKSKDDLIAQALSHVFDTTELGQVSLSQMVADYLSPEHVADLEGGCLTAALGGEVTRQSDDARAVMTTGLRDHLEFLTASAPGSDELRKRQAAIGSWAAMVGGLLLARLSEDRCLSNEILVSTRAWIDEHNQAK